MHRKRQRHDTVSLVLQRFRARFHLFIEGDDDGNGGGSGEGAPPGGDLEKAGSGNSDLSSGDDKGGKGDEGAQGESLFDLGTKSDEGDEGKSSNDDAPARPENCPEKFWDAEAGAVKTEALLKSYEHMENQWSQMKQGKGLAGEVPSEASEYFEGKGIDVPPEADRVGKIPADDPALGLAADLFQKHGIPKDVARSFVKDWIVGINEHLPEPVNMDAERAALGDHAEALIQGTKTWVEGLVASKQLTADEGAYCRGMAGTADGIKMLSKFRTMTGERPLPTLDGRDEHSMTDEQWRDAYSAAIRAGDVKEQERLDELGARLFGTAPAGQSNLRANPRAPRRSA